MIEGPVTERSAPSAAATRAEPSRLQRFGEWFWRGRSIRAAIQALPPGSARKLRDRAELYRDLAEYGRRPEESFRAGPADALVCDLYRQALYFGLLSLHESRQSPQAERRPHKPAPQELLGLLQGIVGQDAERHGSRNTSEHSGSVSWLAEHLFCRSYANLFELDSSERRGLCQELRPLSGRLLARLDSERRHLDRLWMQRSVRTLGALALVAGTVLGAIASGERRDLARGAPWQTSSAYPVAACSSPQQNCPATTHFFFHTTRETRPWIEFDLQGTYELGAAHIQNRSDCCQSRALPLVLEVSQDHKHYQEVARRTEVFDSWEVELGGVSARWVRLRVDGQTFLHLRAVQLFAKQ